MLHMNRLRGEEFPRTDNEDLLRLIDDMKPVDLEARVREEMVAGSDLVFENEDMSAAEARRTQRLELLGQELAGSLDSLRAVGRDLLEAGDGSFYPLGTGPAQGAEAPIEVWGVLRDLHLIDPLKTRQTSVLSGFIQQLDILNSAIADEIRVECRATPALRREYAVFLSRGALSAQEMKHVIEIAGEPDTPAWQFSDVSWREERELSDEDRVRLLRTIFAKPGGHEQVADALRMLHFVEGNARDRWPEDLREVGLDAIIGIISAEELNPTKDDRISCTLSACLRGDDGRGASRVIEAIVDRAARRYGSAYDVQRTLAALAERAPEVFLDRIFADEPARLQLRLEVGRRPGPLLHVPIEALIEWCKREPYRWARVAPWITPFSRGSDDEDEAEQVSPFALAFLEAAPNLEEVVEAYLQNLTPMSLSGSRADIMERRLTAIEALQDHPLLDIRHAIARLAPAIRTQIARIRRAEQEDHRQRDERFE